MLLALYSPGLGVPFLLLAGRALVLRRCADVTSPAGAAQLPSPCGRDRHGWQNRPCLPGAGWPKCGRPAALARWLLAADIGATLLANVLAGLSYGPLGAVVAAWPGLRPTGRPGRSGS